MDKNNSFELFENGSPTLSDTGHSSDENSGFPWDEGTNTSESGESGSPCKKSKSNKTVVSLYEYAETFCYALAVMMIMFLFVFRYVSVDGESMRETLQDEDKLIISNLFYTPETGDIVVIKPDGYRANDEPLIKRIIATEGQTVYIDYDNWEIYVDGVKLEEPYIEGMRENKPMNSTAKYHDEFVVGEGQVFVMGDNRNHSTDSRALGEIGSNRILGRVVLRITPNFGTVD